MSYTMCLLPRRPGNEGLLSLLLALQKYSKGKIGLEGRGEDKHHHLRHEIPPEARLTRQRRPGEALGLFQYTPASGEINTPRKKRSAAQRGLLAEGVPDCWLS